MQHPYTWKDTGDAAQRVNWRIEDVIGDGAGLDLARSSCRSPWRGPAASGS